MSWNKRIQQRFSQSTVIIMIIYIAPVNDQTVKTASSIAIRAGQLTAMASTGSWSFSPTITIVIPTVPSVASVQTVNWAGSVIARVGELVSTVAVLSVMPSASNFHINKPTASIVDKPASFVAISAGHQTASVATQGSNIQQYTANVYIPELTSQVIIHKTTWPRKSLLRWWYTVSCKPEDVDTPVTVFIAGTDEYQPGWNLNMLNWTATKQNVFGSLAHSVKEHSWHRLQLWVVHPSFLHLVHAVWEYILTAN